MLLGRDHPRVVPIGPIVRGVIAFPIFGTWWDATNKKSCVPVGPFAGELWHFEYFPTTTVRHFEFYIVIFDHLIVTVVRICCCVPNFIEIGSRVRLPDAHNCGMFNAPLLGNGLSCGNRIMADMSGTWWDVNTHVASQSVRCRRVMAFRIFSNMAAVRHFEF